jgi:hypothetical protein
MGSSVPVTLRLCVETATNANDRKKRDETVREGGTEHTKGEGRREGALLTISLGP